jgi:hypothetical protein
VLDGFKDVVREQLQVGGHACRKEAAGPATVAAGELGGRPYQQPAHHLGAVAGRAKYTYDGYGVFW